MKRVEKIRQLRSILLGKTNYSCKRGNRERTRAKARAGNVYNEDDKECKIPEADGLLLCQTIPERG